jgi:hypothetical protein
MQTVEASHPSAPHETATRDCDMPASSRPTTAPSVGPLGGIVFSALCLASYVALVVAVAVS